MTTTVHLAERVPLALASGARSIWVAGAGVLQQRDPETGRVLAETSAAIEAPAAVICAAGVVAVAESDSAIAMFDQDTLDEVQRLPASAGGVILAGDDQHIWATNLGAKSFREFRPGSNGTVRNLGRPLAGLAAGANSLWWIERDSSQLQSDSRAVDLPFSADSRIAMTACGGSIWLSAGRQLAWIRQWAGELGGVMQLPAMENIERLICASGVLVGGDRFDAAFVLNPAADNDLRQLKTGSDGPIVAMAGALGVLWLVDENGLAHLFAL